MYQKCYSQTEDLSHTTISRQVCSRHTYFLSPYFRTSKTTPIITIMFFKDLCLKGSLPVTTEEDTWLWTQASLFSHCLHTSRQKGSIYIFLNFWNKALLTTAIHVLKRSEYFHVEKVRHRLLPLKHNPQSTPQPNCYTFSSAKGNKTKPYPITLHQANLSKMQASILCNFKSAPSLIFR